jgi:hypothetical protein
MEDKEAVEVLKTLMQTKKLNPKEAEAVQTAIGALSLMVHQSQNYLRQLKAKKDRQTHA